MASLSNPFSYNEKVKIVLLGRRKIEKKKKKKEVTGIAEQLWDQPLTSRGSASHEAGLDQQAPSGHLREGSP